MKLSDKIREKENLWTFCLVDSISQHQANSRLIDIVLANVFDLPFFSRSIMIVHCC